MSETALFTAEVTDLNRQGFGVVTHPSGKIFFVKGVWVGDLGEFRFSTEDLAQKRPPYATLERLITASNQRVQPFCAHFGFGNGQCQGCSWMMADYAAQLKCKSVRLQKALSDVGIDFKIETVWPSPKTEGYRNRAQFKTDGQILGYVADNHQIAAIQECRILNAPMRSLLKTLLKRLPNPAWKALPGKPWQFLDCDDEMRENDLQLNRRRPFQQGNREQNQNMRDWLQRQMAPLDPKTPILELFCGSGNFTEVLQNAGFENVVCVESDETAIFKIKQKNWRHVQPIAADLYRSRTYSVLQQKIGRREILVLDPPREGLQNKAQLFAAFPKIKRIVYISCDPESFARDAAFFVKDKGFAIESIQPLDVFPHTPHVEILSVFVKPE